MNRPLSLSQAGARPVTCRFVFLLLGSFAPMDLTSAITALETANGQGGHYAWRVLSETGAPLRAGNGLTMMVDGGLQAVCRDDLVMVLGGGGLDPDCGPAVLSWLRGAARQGATLAGIGAGTWALARAGLLEGRRVTTHWSLRAAAQERWPDLQIERTLFTIDGNRITCAGGAATLDMVVQLIAGLDGLGVASKVTEQLVSAAPRGADSEQSIPDHCVTGVRHAKLSAALKLMRSDLEEPLKPSQIAEQVGLSTRQLERLFSKYLQQTPKVYYTRLRLENARAMLQQTDMRIIDVGLANGFTSQSHFSRVYRKRFGISPNAERGFAVG